MREASFPDQGGLAATMLVIFRLKDPTVDRFCTAWWSLILETARRDQLTFNYAAWSSQLHFNYLDLDYTRDTPYWKPGSHNRPAERVRSGLRLSECRDSSGLGRFEYGDLPKNYPAVEPFLNQESDRKEAALIRDINAIIERESPTMEGNYYHTNGSRSSPFLPRDPRREGKRQLLRQLSTESEHVLEIGFNAGHSAVRMLTASDSLDYLGIDLGLHSYSKPTADLLDHHFGHRFQMAWGNSNRVLSQIDDQTSQSFDLVHIDGGHDEASLRFDLDWCVQRCARETRILVDDSYATHISRILEEYCNEGHLIPVRQELSPEVSLYKISGS